MQIESRRWLFLALAAACIWLLHALAPVITPFAFAAVLAYLGDPLVDRIEKRPLFRWKISRSFAVVLVFLVIILFLSSALLLLLPLMMEQFRHLLDRIPEWTAWLMDSALPWLQAKFGLEFPISGGESLREGLNSYWKEASSALLGVLGTISAGGQTMLHWLMNLVLVPVVTFYLLRDWDVLVEGVRTLLPPALEPTVSRLTREIDEVLGAFIRGQLLVMLALGVTYTIGLWLVGLDLAFIIGMIAGLFSVVPYLGTFVGVLAAFIAAMYQFQDLFHPAMVLLVFVVGQSLEGMVLTPKLVGDKVGLHPVAVIFAVLAGGQLFGFLGVLLALPVASALNVLARHAHLRYRDSLLFRDAAAPERES